MKPIALIIVGILIGGSVYALSTLRKDNAPVALEANAASAAAAPMVNVTLPATLSPEATAGKASFDAKCAACHGVNAAGVDGKGPPLVHKIYEPGHHSDMAIMVAPFRGVPAHHWGFGDMPPVEGITEEEMINIIHYIRELQAANGIT